MKTFSFKWLTLAGIVGITLVGCPKQPEQPGAVPEKSPGVSNEVTITPTAPTPAVPNPASTPANVAPTPVASPSTSVKEGQGVKLVAGKRLDPFVEPFVKSPIAESINKNETMMAGLPFTISGIMLSSQGNYAILFNNNISKNVIVKTGDYIDQEKQYKVSRITENQVYVAYGKQTEKLTIASFEDRGPYPDRQMKATAAPGTEDKEVVKPEMGGNQQPSAQKSETPPPPPPGKVPAPKPAEGGGTIW